MGRFARLSAHEVDSVATRARELFDMDALLQALASELNSFNAASTPDSLPRLFLDWASQNLAEKHVVFDEDTCTRVDLDCVFVMAILEWLFLGQLERLEHQTYRGRKMSELFNPRQDEKVAAENHEP